MCCVHSAHAATAACPNEKDFEGQCVYKATCEECGQIYIGETGLFLSSRVKSHENSHNSALKGHCQGVRGFRFAQIARCHNASQRKIRESVEIRENKPQLNENSGFLPYIFT